MQLNQTKQLAIGTAFYFGLMSVNTLVAEPGNYKSFNGWADLTPAHDDGQKRSLFLDHLSKWISETGPESSLDAITRNKHYLRIISMGASALPFIFSDLKKTSAPWFVALRAITGVDPVAPGKAGKFKEMAKDWLAWGKKNRYT